MIITERIKKFSEIYSREVNEKLSKEQESYRLLVNEIPNLIGDWLQKNDKLTNPKIILKGSVGQGNTTFYPWLGIFNSNVSTGATNGFYVVLLFSDDFKDLYLTLNQGSTVQAKEEIERNRSFIYSVLTEVEGFIKGKLPSGSLVKTQPYSSNNKGSLYEDTNLFFKKYIVSDLNEELFFNDLERILLAYQKCVTKYISERINVPPIETFKALSFANSLKESNLIIPTDQAIRFVSALCTKPFVILTGLSGSGKTKLAQAFAQWICENENQYCIVPVGADWTNREPLLGYPNALEKGKYVKPDNGVIDLIIEAGKNPERPFFLILDEMNLSHVERYFADFLSAMELGEASKITLHTGDSEWDGIPSSVKLPKNLFIIGTVNIDETTYMFSPKVLDRANVIEFRVSLEELYSFLKNPAKPDMSELAGAGSGMAADFVALAESEVNEFSEKEKINAELTNFFKELKKIGAEFGYRTASEIYRFAGQLDRLTAKEDGKWKTDDIIDAAVMQKLLPKVHGSRSKLDPVLRALTTLCLADKNESNTLFKEPWDFDSIPKDKIRFPLSLEKIIRMRKRVIQDGFTSFAEA